MQFPFINDKMKNAVLVGTLFSEQATLKAFSARMARHANVW